MPLAPTSFPCRWSHVVPDVRPNDAVIRVPRYSWSLAKKYAVKSGRELRELTGTALEEYVKREEAKRA